MVWIRYLPHAIRKMYPILWTRRLHSSSTSRKCEFLCSQGASLNLTFGACEFNEAHTLHLHWASLVEHWSGWAKSSSQPPRVQSTGMIRWVHRQPKYTWEGVRALARAQAWNYEGAIRSVLSLGSLHRRSDIWTGPGRKGTNLLQNLYTTRSQNSKPICEEKIYGVIKKLLTWILIPV